MVPHKGQTDWVEGAGMGASMLCLIHCIAWPVMIAVLPALDSAIVAPGGFHFWILILAVPLSGGALWAGRVHHGAQWPLAVGMAGLVAIALGALALGGTPGETPLTIVGSLLLVSAHVANWRLRNTCNCFPAE